MLTKRQSRETCF